MKLKTVPQLAAKNATLELAERQPGRS